MSSPARPRASLYFYEGFISISPSVAGCALELQARGYDVDLYYTRPPFDLLPPQLPAGITLHEHVPWTRWLTGAIFARLRRNVLKKLSTVKADATTRQNSGRLRYLAKAVLNFIELPQFALYCRLRRKPMDVAVTFDSTGLFAMSFAIARGTPYVYWSLEILLLEEAPDPFSRWLKLHELRWLRGARAIAIQAATRRTLFDKDAPDLAVPYVEIPNSAPVPLPANLPTDFFRSRSAIPPHTRIVLYAGFISSSFLSLEVAQSVSSWPDGFVLVFHERQLRDPREPYIEAVRAAGGARTFLSLKPVEFDQVDTVYAGADIGIVGYEPAEANLTTAWSSSGKLTYYLRHGMPIIVIAPECPQLLQDWRCGIWISSADGIGAALAEISADYEAYSQKAREAYAALYDFTAAFDNLMPYIR